MKKTSNIEMHWYRQRPDEEDLQQYWAVRILWMGSNGEQQRVEVSTYFMRIGDALHDDSVLYAMECATTGLLCDRRNIFHG